LSAPSIFWWDRGPTAIRVKATDVGVEPIQRLVSSTCHRGWVAGIQAFVEMYKQGDLCFLLAADKIRRAKPFTRRRLILSAAFENWHIEA